MVFSPLFRRDEPAQRLIREGLQRPREELALPERCGICFNKLVEPCRDEPFALVLFRFQQRRTMSPTIARAGDGVLPAYGSLSRDRRVWMNSPCPRRTNMKAIRGICNRSFDHFLEPKKSS